MADVEDNQNGGNIWEYWQIFTVTAEQILTHCNTVFVLIVKSKRWRTKILCLTEKQLLFLVKHIIYSTRPKGLLFSKDRKRCAPHCELTVRLFHVKSW